MPEAAEVNAHAAALALSAEELYEEGQWLPAAERFEAASEAYVAATLLTGDPGCIQALRLLARDHAEKAHELRMRIKLHGISLKASADPPTTYADDEPPSREKRQPVDDFAASSDAIEASRAFARLSLQLMSAHEELRFGADELVRVLAVANSQSSTSQAPSTGIMAGSSSLINSFCVVPSQCTPTASNSSHLAQSPQHNVGPGSTGFASKPERHAEPTDVHAGSAQLAADNARLNQENSMLRWQLSEVRSHARRPRSMTIAMHRRAHFPLSARNCTRADAIRDCQIAAPSG